MAVFMAALYSLITQFRSAISLKYLLLVELSLAEQEEVDSLSALPRVGQSFVSRGADVTRDQGVHRLCSHICSSLAGACDLGDLGVKDTLLVRVDFEGCQDVNLLD